jgi:hypothetical protein
VAAPSIKQRLAAPRMLFDWLVIGQVLPVNPSVVGKRTATFCEEGQNASSDHAGGSYTY